MTTINFTKRELDKLPLPRAGERPCYYDEYQHNLMLRISHTGQKIFYVRRKVNGISERVQLGRYPEMTIEKTRKKRPPSYPKLVRVIIRSRRQERQRQNQRLVICLRTI